VPNVLLLNSDRHEVLGLLRSRPGVRLNIITAAKYADLAADGIRTAIVPAIDDLTAVRDAASELARREQVDVVIAATEKSVIPAALVRAQLGVPGQGLDEAYAFAHKHAMKRRLRAAGLPVARSRPATSRPGLLAAAQDLGYPVVVKPVTGALAARTYRVEHPAELSGLIAAGALGPGPYQVERFVEMLAEYHCDGVVRGGRTVAAPVSRYFQPLLGLSSTAPDGSYTLPQDLPQAREISALHQRVVEALGAGDCVTHLECFETTEGMVIGEIACRPGGGAIALVLRSARGIEIWDEFVRAALGEPSALTEPASDAAGSVDATHGWLSFRSGAAPPTGHRAVVALHGAAGSYDLVLRTENQEAMTAAAHTICEDRARGSRAEATR